MAKKKQQVVVVTGASAGVGRAAVQAFAATGADVALIARGRDGLLGAKREVERAGGRALMLPLDVSDHNAVDQAAELVERKLGPIDVWVNNAMVSVFSPALEMEPEEYQRVTDVTYLGVVYGTLAALRRMKERNRGTIIQVGSALALRSIPLQSAYCAAKHAILGFTDSLRCELFHDKIPVHLSVVHMPALNTPQFSWVKSRLPNQPQPVPPIFQPEVAARAIVYAAENHPRELWVGGPTVKAIVGQMFIPGILDHYLGKTGYRAQQTDEPVARNRRDNLWDPVAGDHGAHGSFDSRARDTSAELWTRTHLGVLTGLTLIAGGAIAAAFKSKSQKREEFQRAA